MYIYNIIRSVFKASSSSSKNSVSSFCVLDYIQYFFDTLPFSIILYSYSLLVWLNFFFYYLPTYISSFPCLQGFQIATFTLFWTILNNFALILVVCMDIFV